MAKIVSYTAGSAGHMFPAVALLQELRRRGHAVSVATYGQEPDVVVDGIEVRSAPAPAHEPPVRLQPNSGRKLTTEEFASLGQPTAEALAAVIAKDKPDVVLLDPLFWGAVCAADALDVAWAVLAHNPLMYRGRGVDIRGPGLPPPAGWVDTVRYWALWRAMRARDDEFLPLLNEVRRTYGLGTLRHTWDVDLLAPLIIANTAEPFEYPRTDWPEALRFVGALAWDPPAGSADCLGTNGRGLILVSGPSISDALDTSWVQRVWEVLASEPFDVVATFPSGASHGPVPEGIELKRFASHSALLRRAALLICHGGWGVTQKALAAAVPVLAVAQGYDRFEVGRRLEVSEAGVMLRGHELMGKGVRVALARAFDRARGANRVAESFARAGGVVAGADAIEKLLKA